MARVLLADDEEALRYLLGRQLRKAGHEVTLAEDGLAAASLLEQHEFDVIVSDMKMPRLDGMGLLARARASAPETEFIILTGHGSMENAVEAFKTGNVFDYLLKPLEDIRELDAVMERAIERRQLRLDNRRLVAELKFLAERDGLTGLFNYRAMHRILDSVVEQAGPSSATVMLIDVDEFKQFNDTYGHTIGDQVLRFIGAAIERACGVTAFAGRCGGDEFMIVMPDATSEDARRLAESIRFDIEGNPFRNPQGTALPVTFCAGYSDSLLVGETDSAAVRMLASADAALYNAKHAGEDAPLWHSIVAGIDAENRSTFDVLDGLVTAIDHKDHYTRRHSEYVTTFALDLAETMGMSEETLNALRIAGLLHDVGKIGIPDSILRKPGGLSEAEYEVMKSHVTISGLIIHGLPRLGDIIDAVANHHERWDGSGYPKGLVGYEIPLLGRVLAIADALSAMTLDRPYRKGLPMELALAEIEKAAGTQFDPDLAVRFVQAMREKRKQSLPKAA